jgi:Ethanolamine utilization protein EutJ (predicted chaperonin)
MTSVTPKCPKCEGTEFASIPIKPTGSNVEVGAVCCARCGTVVGIQESVSIVSKVHELEKKLGFTFTHRPKA